MRKKLVVTFDSEARREYLTGFRKRKQQRKTRAKLEKAKHEKQRLKEAKKVKCQELHKKLEKYGLSSRDDGHKVDHPVLDQHPNHVVVIDTNPKFGLSLSSMIEET